MAALDNALTTLARTKSFLEISGTSKDLILTMLILGASRYIQDTYLGKTLKRTAYTNELYDGKGAKRLWVKNPPIVSGQTVTLQHRTTPNNENSWETISSENYFINYEGGYIELIRDNDTWDGLYSTFKEGVQNYRLSYTGGYYLPIDSQYQDGTDDNLDMPYDLEIAVLDFVSALYNQRQSGGIKSQRVGDVSIEYANELEKHPTIKHTLDRYKTMSYA